MKEASKSGAGTAGTQPAVTVDSEVVRTIRQHARSSPDREICGVLIGQDRDRHIRVTACIEGENADEAGAHVTFTQETWEHIYAVKDKKFPDERIVGWYHSHPGFGIFLSEHDTFIHKNFFSSPGQVAWVFDPHSDEEGCFGWVGGEIERLARIAVSDRRGGEPAEAGPEHEPAATSTKPRNKGAKSADDKITVRVRRSTEDDEGAASGSLEQLVAKVFFSLALLILGGALSWYLFPHIVIMPVAVDPMTGRPLDPQAAQLLEELQAGKGGKQDPAANAGQNPPADGAARKGGEAHAK
ncbi:MAG TPA: Mov34/MPN/PAD-1 family protein [Candidatus Sulfotelmatobacter sp.]|jgi:proteasome lid subunit RPN8/RPN11